MNFIVKSFDVLDSTNDYVKQHYRTLTDQTIIRTNYQTRGRGQFQRRWESEANQNLLFSMLFKDNLSYRNVKQIEQVTLEGLIEVLKAHGVHAHIKLPNDIYVNDRKIAGILIETRQQDGVFDYLIVGVGLNVLQRTFPENIKATSLIYETMMEYRLDDVFNQLLEYITSKVNDL